MRFHDALYKNLLRISMDDDYLKNLVLAHNGQTNNPGALGFEPEGSEGVLTPEKLKEILKEFLNICARKTGMERILAIRRRLAGINYSKKTISVEFYLGRPLESTSQDLARPPDGKCLSHQNLTPVPHSGTKSFCPPARTSESNLLDSSEKEKGSNRLAQSDPFGRFETYDNGWGAWIRTREWRLQRPLPYRLATPQNRVTDSRLPSTRANGPTCRGSVSCEIR